MNTRSRSNNNSFSWLLYIVFLLIQITPAHCIPSYQCEEDGKIIYQPFPCANTTKLSPQLKQHTNEQDLIVFSRQANEAKVYELLSQGISANVTDEHQHSPLFYALDQQYYSIAKLLIAANADPNFVLPSGWNLLMHTAAKGDTAAMQLLLDSGAKLENKSAKDGNTALAVAVEARQLSAVQLLLAKGADPNAVNHEGLTPVILALTTNSPNMVNILLANKANLDQLSHPLNKNLSATPLIHFATYGDEKNVLSLLRLGANVNLANEQNISPLAAAAMVGNYNMVKLLLTNGASREQVIAEPKLWQLIQNQGNNKIAALLTE